MIPLNQLFQLNCHLVLFFDLLLQHVLSNLIVIVYELLLLQDRDLLFKSEPDFFKLLRRQPILYTLLLFELPKLFILSFESVQNQPYLLYLSDFLF